MTAMESTIRELRDAGDRASAEVGTPTPYTPYPTVSDEQGTPHPTVSYERGMSEAGDRASVKRSRVRVLDRERVLY